MEVLISSLIWTRISPLIYFSFASSVNVNAKSNISINFIGMRNVCLYVIIYFLVMMLVLINKITLFIHYIIILSYLCHIDLVYELISFCI